MDMLDKIEKMLPGGEVERTLGAMTWITSNNLPVYFDWNRQEIWQMVDVCYGDRNLHIVTIKLKDGTDNMIFTYKGTQDHLRFNIKDILKRLYSGDDGYAWIYNQHCKQSQ